MRMFIFSLLQPLRPNLRGVKRDHVHNSHGHAQVRRDIYYAEYK